MLFRSHIKSLSLRKLFMGWGQVMDGWTCFGKGVFKF